MQTMTCNSGDIRLTIGDREYQVDLSHYKSIAIPLEFGGGQPNFYGIQPASRQPLAAGSFVGSVRQGGSCNVDALQFVPHCNGTHTETVGHLLRRAVPIGDVHLPLLMPTLVISAAIEPASSSGETYQPPFESGDRVVTAARLAEARSELESGQPSALVLRTLPNHISKVARRYTADQPPAFLTSEAMQWIIDQEVEHLLVDLPSLDRIVDDGLLSNHRRWWRVKPGSHDLTPDVAISQTVTEMVFVPDSIPDGWYALNLQFPAFCLDAAPSRPLLYRLHSV